MIIIAIKFKKILIAYCLTLFRMEGRGGGGWGGGGGGGGGGGPPPAWEKGPLLVFPPQFLQMQKSASKTLGLLVLSLLPHWCKISNPYPVPVPNY